MKKNANVRMNHDSLEQHFSKCVSWTISKISKITFFFIQYSLSYCGNAEREHFPLCVSNNHICMCEFAYLKSNNVNT